MVKWIKWKDHEFKFISLTKFNKLTTNIFIDKKMTNYLF